MIVKNENERRKAFNKIAKQLNITNPRDWGKVTRSQLWKLGYSSLIAPNSSLFATLQATYPGT